MKLNISTEDAIEILETRKNEIRYANFDYKVWQDKTKNDLNEIFGLGDTKWLQISAIKFTSYYQGKTLSALENGKRQAEEYLQSYIELINKYSEIENKNFVENEKFYEQEYKKSATELSEVYQIANTLLTEKETFLNEIEAKDEQINNLEKNTVQLNAITVNKLFGLIKNLPIQQTIGLITTLFAVLGFVFYLGGLVKENSFLKSDYEKQKEIDFLKEKLEKKNLKSEKVEIANKSKTDSINKVRSE